MKLSVNRNTVWCDVFVQRLVKLGVKYACISPGSRSTPLTLATASNSQIKTFPIVDERSSSFFALGIAKQTNNPVVVVTTSGTAVAELYPAVIEAYYQRIPLIICTADRPSSLINSGANQTINQRNIYKNHIRFFADAGLPDLKNLNYILSLAEQAVITSSIIQRGPVHINFPFDKPFEPKSYTDKINIDTINKAFSKISPSPIETRQTKINFEYIANKFLQYKKGLIFVGYSNYSKEFGKLLTNFSRFFGYPVYVDGSASLRFGPHEKENIIENLISIVRTKNFQKEFDPDLIIQFGAAPTSNVLLEFFKKSNAEKILVNEFGDRYDPSLTAKKIFAYKPEEYCTSVLNVLLRKVNIEGSWIENFRRMDEIVLKVKKHLIEKAEFPFEGRIINELINALPEKSNLMISNSLPIRDADFFASKYKKQINVFTNRGASGIDGINSTAMGIAKTSKNPTYLLTGDLAFYHDMNGLHNSLKFKIPLTIILINNGGGGIFESLPISDYKEFLSKNFLTPLNIDFNSFVDAYKGNYIKIKSWRQFHWKLLSSVWNKRLTVLEIKTDAVKSKQLRQKYWAASAKEIEKFINEIKR